MKLKASAPTTGNGLIDENNQVWYPYYGENSMYCYLSPHYVFGKFKQINRGLFEITFASKEGKEYYDKAINKGK